MNTAKETQANSSVKSAMAVSYTHLDVYKRQDINRKVLSELAISDPAAFTALAEKAKDCLLYTSRCV